METFFGVMAVLFERPWLAIVPALGFVSLYAVSRQLIALLPAAMWLLYLPYEYGMKFRILCSGECNIRIDLLVLYPALVIASHAAVLVSWRKRRVRA